MPKNWSDIELEASVRCYLEMKDKEFKGIKFFPLKFLIMNFKSQSMI